MRNRDRELLTQTKETEREVTKRRLGTTDLETQRCRNRGSRNRSPLPFPGAQSVLAEEWGGVSMVSVLSLKLVLKDCVCVLATGLRYGLVIHEGGILKVWGLLLTSLVTSSL